MVSLDPITKSKIPCENFATQMLLGHVLQACILYTIFDPIKRQYEIIPCCKIALNLRKPLFGTHCKYSWGHAILLKYKCVIHGTPFKVRTCFWNGILLGKSCVCLDVLLSFVSCCCLFVFVFSKLYILYFLYSDYHYVLRNIYLNLFCYHVVFYIHSFSCKLDPSGKQQYFVSACWVGQIQPFS